MRSFAHTSHSVSLPYAFSVSRTYATRDMHRTGVCIVLAFYVAVRTVLNLKSSQTTCVVFVCVLLLGFLGVKVFDSEPLFSKTSNSIFGHAMHVTHVQRYYVYPRCCALRSAWFLCPHPPTTQQKQRGALATPPALSGRGQSEHPHLGAKCASSSHRVTSDVSFVCMFSLFQCAFPFQTCHLCLSVSCSDVFSSMYIYMSYIPVVFMCTHVNTGFVWLALRWARGDSGERILTWRGVVLCGLCI